MTYFISTLWLALTTAGLLMEGPVFNVAVASTILIVLLLIVGALVCMGCIAAKRYDAIKSLPERHALLRWVSCLIDCSPGIAIASIGHPVLDAGYLFIYGVAKITADMCKSIAKRGMQ